VEGLLADLTWGQVRRLTLSPSRPVPIARLSLESFDTHTALTFFAATAETR
jgi:hypothetical protein